MCGPSNLKLLFPKFIVLGMNKTTVFPDSYIWRTIKHTQDTSAFLWILKNFKNIHLLNICEQLLLNAFDVAKFPHILVVEQFDRTLLKRHFT